MKQVVKKMVSVIGLMAIATSALAHSQAGGVGKKTSGEAATDVYAINCYDDGEGAGVPTQLNLRIKDNAPKLAPTISAQVTKKGLASVPTVDAVDGNADYSPWVILKAGAGEYTVLINKSASTAKGIEAYTLEFHCQSASGHAGTDISMSQNQ